MTGKRVFLLAEHLRSRVPGGIGTHINAILSRIPQLSKDFPSLDFVVVASQPLGDDPLANVDLPKRYLSVSHSLFMRLSDLRVPMLGKEPGIYHSFTIQLPPTRGVLAKKVVTIHDLAFVNHPDFYTRRGVKWHMRQLRDVTREAASIVTVSQNSKEDLSHVGLDPARVHLINSGSDHLSDPDFTRCDEILAFNGVSGPFLLSVSTLEPRKNLLGLIEAFAIARESSQSPLDLVLVGPSGWGGAPRSVPGVKFLGHVSDSVLSALYIKTEAVVYVPFEEGFGLPVVEAMAAGAPVVCSRVPSSGGVGEIVDPMNVASIAKGIQRVLREPGYRDLLRSKGLLRAAELTWLHAAEEHMALWERL